MKKTLLKRFEMLTCKIERSVMPYILYVKALPFSVIRKFKDSFTDIQFLIAAFYCFIASKLKK